VHHQRSMVGRLVRFHLANGVTSVLSNLIWMRVLVGYFGAPVMLSNVIAIAPTGLVNFALSEWFVFRRRLCRA